MKANRLAQETSPYLLQHAHNPVEWYPWGDEAIGRARAEDRPILLSIGYSACHWCHVMERESFENDETAAIMNASYVNIKVDREERPDLDQVYMNAVQVMTGSGGWPLTVFLTPELKPFFGGTYFPPDERYGRPGFPRVLRTIAEAYRHRRQEIEENARTLLEHLNRESSQTPGGSPVSAEDMAAAVRHLYARFDARNGGFGSAPKFPSSMVLDFLLRCQDRNHDDDTRSMIETTLDKMACGGIYDHAGGGFHRYSTDERWLVSHFEKMLYDNALLASTYLDAYKLLGKPLYRKVVEETLDFVVRELTDANGGFYSTLDADSEGVEGKFYVWTAAEFRTAAGEDAELLAKYFDVTEHGNFEHRNILNIPREPAVFARLEGVAEADLETRARKVLDRLLEVRATRIRPGRDEKILTDWNGLMLRAFADAAAAFDRPDYRQIAERNAAFLLNTLWDGAVLLHCFKDNRARFNGYLDDYANLADGLLALYESTFDAKWLHAATALTDRMIDQFGDGQAGGFYFTARNHEKLIVRSKDHFDNATPSGNSVAVNVLLRLALLMDRPDLRDKAVQTAGASMELARQFPNGFGRLWCGLDFILGPSREIAIAGDPSEFAAVLRRRFLPRTVVAAGSADSLPLLKSRTAVDGKPTAYVCRNSVCDLPVTTAADFERQLA